MPTANMVSYTLSLTDRLWIVLGSLVAVTAIGTVGERRGWISLASARHVGIPLVVMFLLLMTKWVLVMSWTESLVFSGLGIPVYLMYLRGADALNKARGSSFGPRARGR